MQWRIQDFPDGWGGGTDPPGGGENILFGKIFAENCMKEIEWGEGTGRV